MLNPERRQRPIAHKSGILLFTTQLEQSFDTSSFPQSMHSPSFLYLVSHNRLSHSSTPLNVAPFGRAA
jgi:hypothetical protein